MMPGPRSPKRSNRGPRTLSKAMSKMIAGIQNASLNANVYSPTGLPEEAGRTDSDVQSTESPTITSRHEPLYAHEIMIGCPTAGQHDDRARRFSWPGRDDVCRPPIERLLRRYRREPGSGRGTHRPR